MAWLVSLPTHFRIALVAGLLALAWVVHATVEALLAPGVQPDFANKDFANYWAAGKLVLSGRTADLFGPQPVYFEHLKAAFGADYPWHNWSYPPHYLLLVWPLGFFGYKTAMMLFLGVTCIFYLRAVGEFAGRRNHLVWIALLPLLAHNLWAAQNGYLFAGCAIAALALRGRRPVLAGIFLGVLTIKPQLGLLFPFLLLAERRWLVIVSASMTTIALVVLSSAVFGLENWQGYLGEVVPYQALVMRELNGTFLEMLPSVYGALRNWGVASETALPVHLVVAVPVFLSALAGFFLARSDEDRSILLLVATFAVSPYALTYDLGLLAPALGLLAARLADTDRVAGAILVAAILLPVIMIPLGALHIVIAPAVILWVYAFALHESGAWRRMKAMLRPA